MKSIELLKLLRTLNKVCYTIADLEKITGLSRNSLYVALQRWIEGGVMERVGQGIYVPMGGSIALDNIAAQIYIPNYLSFESALARYGILNLVPYTLTFATTRKTRKYTLQKQEVEFRQISPGLFFGYEMKNGIYIALPEKAFLDALYFSCKGRAVLDFDELDINKLSTRQLKLYAERFPDYVRKRLFEILLNEGKT